MKPTLNRSSVGLRARSLPAVLLALVIATSCALTQEHINVGYAPQTNVTPISAAQHATVSVTVVDQRATRSHIGHKINGYGMEMAEIIADNDIPQTIKSGVESELRDRGFTLGSDGSAITIELGKLENRFEIGFFSGTAVSDISMAVTVRRPNQSIAYTRSIHAEGVNSGVQLASGENARIALETALKNAVAELFADPGFVGALLPPAQQSVKS